MNTLFLLPRHYFTKIVPLKYCPTGIKRKTIHFKKTEYSYKNLMNAIPFLTINIRNTFCFPK